jgi:tetratricopeptide (TPR) repeat protein
VILDNVAGGLINKGSRLYQLERYAEALETYDAVIRLQDRLEPDISKHVVSALFGKGLTLTHTGDLVNASTILKQVITLRPGNQDPEIVETQKRATQALEWIRSQEVSGRPWENADFWTTPITSDPADSFAFSTVNEMNFAGAGVAVLS